MARMMLLWIPSGFFGFMIWTGCYAYGIGGDASTAFGIAAFTFMGGISAMLLELIETVEKNGRKSYEQLS